MKFIAEKLEGRDNHFNLIRMCAASGVVISHAWRLSLGPDTLPPLEASTGFALGTICVILFFAISGMMITASYHRSRTKTSYLKARALRLFPALFVSCVLTMIFLFPIYTGTAEDYLPEAIGYVVRNTLMFDVKYFIPGLFDNNPISGLINGSLWTLFYEACFYVGVLLIGVLGLFRYPRLCVAGFLAGITLLLANAHLELFEIKGRMTHLFLLGIPFATGAIIYILRDRIPLSPLLCIVVAIAIALSHGTFFYEILFLMGTSYIFISLGFLLPDILLNYNKLGDYSYGTYIFGVPVQQYMAYSGVSTPLGNILWSYPVILLLAVLSWKYVEEPSLNLKHKSLLPLPFSPQFRR